ncbi:MAG: helix-hairpin-helix domain-containing protein [Nocardioidaceae bacterium]
MFGRHTSPDGDAVAAAQRRLAALAAQFDATPQVGATSSSRRSPEPVPGPDGEPTLKFNPNPNPNLNPNASAETEPTSLSSSEQDEDHADSDETASSVEPMSPSAGHDVARSTAQRRGGRHAARGSAAQEYGGWDITTHHVTLAALTVAVLIAVTAWWVLRAKPEVTTVTSERTMPSSASPSAAIDPLAPYPSSGSPAATTITPPAPGAISLAAPGGSVVVDVAGKVRSPGIVELPVGSRIVDAIDSAGGVRPGVDTASLNLARVLVDGEQIVVGVEVPIMPPPSGVTGTSPSSELTAMIDLNAATAEQLETLPGIGPVTAAAILAWRSENGAFSTVDELLEVSGIGDATLAEVAGHVYV